MKSILLIDDDPGVLKAVGRLLQAAGHKVIATANGAEAIRKYLSEKIDLVITDMVMPEQSGIEVINRLRTLDPRLPVIAITGDPQTMKDAALNAGAAAVLNKPLEEKQLLRAVEDTGSPP
jgi:CheY-like chemotaxis protein